MDERYLVIGAVLVALTAVLAFRRRPRTPPPTLSAWFAVISDETKVTLSARPPGKQPWEQSFLWCEVVRVCFKSEGLSASDGVYVFTSQRPESFVVPMEADGASTFWSNVVERGLFPSELAARVITLPEGAVECWPKARVQA